MQIKKIAIMIAIFVTIACAYQYYRHTTHNTQHTTNENDLKNNVKICSGCTEDSQCGSGYYCDNGTCIYQEGNGNSCIDSDGQEDNSECTSGNCYGGICQPAEVEGMICSNPGQCKSNCCVQGLCGESYDGECSAADPLIVGLSATGAATAGVIGYMYAVDVANGASFSSAAPASYTSANAQAEEAADGAQSTGEADAANARTTAETSGDTTATVEAGVETKAENTTLGQDNEEIKAETPEDGDVFDAAVKTDVEMH